MRIDLTRWPGCEITTGPEREILVVHRPLPFQSIPVNDQSIFLFDRVPFLLETFVLQVLLTREGRPQYSLLPHTYDHEDPTGGPPLRQLTVLPLPLEGTITGYRAVSCHGAGMACQDQQPDALILIARPTAHSGTVYVMPFVEKVVEDALLTLDWTPELAGRLEEQRIFSHRPGFTVTTPIPIALFLEEPLPVDAGPTPRTAYDRILADDEGT